MSPGQRVAFEHDGVLKVAAGAGPLVLRWRRSARARRLCLRAGAKGIERVVPARMALAEAGAFAVRHVGWIARQMIRLPATDLVRHGSIVPLEGVDHRVIHRTDAEARGPAGERVVWRHDGGLHVRGAAEHLPRRLEDWLRAEARQRLATLAPAKARLIGTAPVRVTVRDTVSRWGSCSSAGALSFCWRLIVAPPWVLDYVTAHEVAHLRHMNHGAAFWRTCAGLLGNHADMLPGVPPERVVQRARGWLRRHGGALHAVRFRA
ncbi:MAG: SprT family zinc-dependent metalloprotease [Alphaproteobacteria bacterium]